MIIDKIKYLTQAPEADLEETISELSGLIIECSDAEMLREVAELLIDVCDTWDGEDAFGTEGWRHRLGLD